MVPNIMVYIFTEQCLRFDAAERRHPSLLEMGEGRALEPGHLLAPPASAFQGTTSGSRPSQALLQADEEQKWFQSQIENYF